MAGSSNREVSLLLKAWSDGDNRALNDLIPIVYGDLHRLAHCYIRRERPGRTLQTTALINEVYLRLAGTREVEWRDRAHFYAISASIMRRVLVDMARSRKYKKRGGDLRKVSLDENLFVPSDPNIVEIDAALNALACIDERKAKVVELRFYGGLSEKETAEVLSVSLETVKRDWRLAKVWLLRELKTKGRNED